MGNGQYRRRDAVGLLTQRRLDVAWLSSSAYVIADNPKLYDGVAKTMPDPGAA